MPQLVCRGLTLGYEGKTVLEGLDFSVEAGDYLCIVGENGSGKSTLMKTLLGLIPPLAGEIVFGEGLGKNSIGYLPQQELSRRDFPASVREVVQSGCVAGAPYRPFYTKAQKMRAADSMARMGISDIADESFCRLSGGQKQRALLARALCAADKMLLLDEPVSGLDPKVSARMYDLIDSLNKDDGVTVIMISHDISAAVQYARHILHLGSRDVFFGSVEEYRESPHGMSFISGAGK